MSRQEGAEDQLGQVHLEHENVLSRVWAEYSQCKDCLERMRGKEQDYKDAIDRLRDQKDEREETIRELYISKVENEAQIEQLNQSIGLLMQEILVQRRRYEEQRGQREAYERTVSALYQTVDELRAANQRNTAEILRLAAANHHGLNVQSDYLAAFTRVSDELASTREALRSAEALSAQGVEYLYDEHNYDAMGPADVSPRLMFDIGCAENILRETTITTSAAGSALWVSVEWEAPTNAADNDAVSEPICLRIELNATLYMNAPTPPLVKFTRGGEEIPLGHRLVHMLKQYLHRHWSAQGGFSIPPVPHSHPLNTPLPTEFMFDTDPRCVVPYVADEGGLITHLVRYTMLRMETYADFCVVCDRPIEDKRDVICGRQQCDHSFHGLGVGYDAVGVERTPHTAPELKSWYSPPPAPDYVPGEPLTLLLTTFVIHKLQSAKQYAWVCSAGSKGYRAVKEMLQNGVPGHTFLLEGSDLHDTTPAGKGYCRISLGQDIYIILTPHSVHHLAVFSNSPILRNGFLARCVGLTELDLSPLSRVTEVHRGFLEGCRGLTALNLSPLSRVTEVNADFLRGCTGLTELDLSPLSQVTEVHGDFLAGCSGLTELDLSPLSRVTGVHRGFLEGCRGLTALDLSPLSQITQVPERFLKGCSGLTALDLSGLSQVTEVQEGFLERCTGLTALNLSPLSQVIKVRQEFLKGCSGLTDLDLNPLSKVTEVRWGFLEGCTSLTVLDLSPLSRVTEVDADFLRGCTGLTELDLSPLSQVTEVHSGFLARCTGLTELDLSPLSKIVEVQRSFLEGCTGLTALDLSPLSQVIKVHQEFLKGCTGLTALDLSPLSQITEVQGDFLEGCSGLTVLDLSPLSQVGEVSTGFLEGCSGLTELNLSPLSHVRMVQGYFLQGCTGLTALNLSPLSQVTEVREGFLEGCTGLTELDLSPLSKITEVHWGFLEGCTGLTALDLSPISKIVEVPERFLKGCSLNAVTNPPPRCEIPSGWRYGAAGQWVRKDAEDLGSS